MKKFIKMIMLTVALTITFAISATRPAVADGGATGTSCCHWGGGVQCCTVCKPGETPNSNQPPKPCSA